MNTFTISWGLSFHRFSINVLGIGKTTLVQKVCAALIEKHNVTAHGFYTNEVRGQGGHGIRIGFDVVGTDGSRAPLARITR